MLWYCCTASTAFKSLKWGEWIKSSYSLNYSFISSCYGA
jgi:hypothetical protein